MLKEKALSDVFDKVLRTFVFNRHITLRKVVNGLRAYSYYRFFSKSQLKSFPVRLVIDTGNICTLKCPLCPTGKSKGGREIKLMGFEKYKRIIDETHAYLFDVDLYNWGEPFLNRDIFRMIEYAKNKNIQVNISSNFNNIPEAYLYSIVDSGLDNLIISIDGADQEAYAKYRKNGDFDSVICSLRKVISIKNENKSKTPKVTWQFLVMKQNEKQIEQAKRMALEMGVDRIAFRNMRCDMADEIFMSDDNKINSAKEWLPADDKWSRYDYEEGQRKNKTVGCVFLDTMMVINPNGSVSPCCGVYEEKWDFGNVFDRGVFDVWNNEKYRRARETVRKRDASDRTLVCSYCVENGFLEY